MLTDNFRLPHQQTIAPYFRKLLHRTSGL